MKSKLIVIEGACDGIGKSTQFALLKEKLTEMGKTVVTHHFPSYGTTRAALVESYLKGELGSPDTLSPYLVNTLYATDRALTWREVISPALNESSLVLLDRYTTSSIIYQSALITDEGTARSTCHNRNTRLFHFFASTKNVASISATKSAVASGNISSARPTLRSSSLPEKPI